MARTSRLYGPYRWVALVMWVTAVAYFVGGISGALPNYPRVVPLLVLAYLLATAKARSAVPPTLAPRT